MNRNQFLRKVRNFGKSNNMLFDFDESRGKGSHGLLTLGTKRTTVPKEIGPGLFKMICKQLDIDLKELE
jgi:HicA toxin of bacterial toxin-antitoxin,